MGAAAVQPIAVQVASHTPLLRGAAEAFGAFLHARHDVRALELGPGGALARMMGGMIGARDSRSASEFRSIEGVARWLLHRPL